MESSHLDVLKVWITMAWADGRISSEEGAALRRFINGSLAPGSPAHRQAMEWLESPGEGDLASLSALTPDARAGIYMAAWRIANIDGELAPAERVLLDRLAEKLELSAATVKEIEG